MYTREQAVEIMNNWGMQRIPFLFVIDFEMQKILLHRSDMEQPANVRYLFPDQGGVQEVQRKSRPFTFRKKPLSYTSYNHLFSKVNEQIVRGNSFLLNLTVPTPIETSLTLQEIYCYSNAKYKILVEDSFVCFSPETFVTIKDGMIASYPMKGTIKASIPQAAEKIMDNRKETAEHSTIVDLIRNDLSMVATDVSVKRFRYIDRVKTHDGDILQVSSEITGRLSANYWDNIGTIIFTMLPAGSVTGAPKPKTIDIIRRVETIPRGYYTGIFGYFNGTDLDSAVMIRFIEKKEGQLWFRSGGGITHMSDPESEYQELIDKVYVPIV